MLNILLAAVYVVIAPHDLKSNWDTYVAARQTAHSDITFEVVDADTIYSTYAVGTDGVRNPAESIHKWIRNYKSTNSELKYVVLGGAWIDAQNLPTAQYFDGTETLMSTNNCVPGVYAYCRYTGGMGPFPSDMFYACLDIPEGTTYPWDPNGDGKYLDDSENRLNTNGVTKVDYTPDIVVSRIPLKLGSGSGDYYYSGCSLKKADGTQYSLGELLEAYTAKLTRGESADFNGIGSYALLAGNAACEEVENNGNYAEYKFYDGYPNLNDDDHKANSFVNAEMAVRRWLKALIAPYQVVTNVDLVTAGDTSNKADLYNKDHVFFWPSTHGDKDWLYTDGGYYSSVFVGAMGNSTGLTLFQNMAGPCDTGYPDCTYTSNGTTYGAPSFAESAILAPNGGALASIANSRVGVYDTSWSITLEGDAYSTRKAINVAKAFIQDGKNAGEAWLAMLNAAEDSANWTDTTMIYSYVEETLFGDPLVKAPTAFHNDKFAGIETSETSLTISSGKGLGGKGIVFTGDKGTAEITANDFYLSGITNGTLKVSANDMLVELDGCHFASTDDLSISSGVTNLTLRSLTEGVLTNTLNGNLYIPANAQVNLDTKNAFGSTTGTIYLGNGSTLRLVNNTEPLNATVSLVSGSATISVASGVTFEPTTTLPAGVTVSYEDPDYATRYEFGNLASASAHGSYIPSSVTLTLAAKGAAASGDTVTITNITIAVDGTGKDVAEYLKVNDVTSSAKVYETTAYASGVYLVHYAFPMGVKLTVGTSYAVTFLDSSSATITSKIRFKLTPSTAVSPLSTVANGYSTCARVQGVIGELGSIDFSGVMGIAERMGSGLADKLTIVEIDADSTIGDDYAIVGPDAAGTGIKIQATSLSAASFGLGQYLRNTAKGHISWCGNRMPTTWPVPESDATYVPAVPVRFAYNYCTLSYTMAYWSKQEWREEIDRLALSGYNVALVLQGLQWVWHETLRQMGYDDAKIHAYIADEACQAWWHMGNLEGSGMTSIYQLTDEHMQADAELGRWIYAEMMKVGIQPGIQSFVGLVPDCSGTDSYLANKAPRDTSTYATYGADTNWQYINEGSWQGYTRPDVISPLSVAFDDFSYYWYNMLTNVYDTAHAGKTKYLCGDLFHEGGSSGSLTASQLAQSAEKIQATQAQYFGDDVTWVLQSWQGSPYQGIRNGLNLSRSLIQVLDKDMSGTGSYDASYIKYDPTTGAEVGRIPWIWVEVLNFGGNTGMHGGARRFRNLPKLGTASASSAAFRGYGILSEGLETNPTMYDMFAEAFTTEVGSDNGIDANAMPTWLANYIERRYGYVDDNLKKAYSILLETVWDCSRYQEGCVENVMCAGPSYSITCVSKWGPSGGTEYDITELYPAAKAMMDAAEANPELLNLDTFKYDLCELFLQLLGDKGRSINKEMATSASKRAQFLRFFDLAEDLLACSDRWTLKWHEDRTTNTVAVAEDGTSLGIAGYRRMITSWSAGYDAGQSTGLREYAHRAYGGLLKDYYKKRWEYFFERTEGTLSSANYTAALRELDTSFTNAVLTATVVPEGGILSACEAIYNEVNPPALTWTNNSGDGYWDSANANWTDEDGTAAVWQDDADAFISGRGTIKASGVVSTGAVTLETSDVTDTSSYTGYLGTDSANPVTLFTNITEADFAGFTATMNGGYVAEGTAKAYFINYDPTTDTTTMQFQMIDDGYLKAVFVTMFRDSDNTIKAYATEARYIQGGALGTDVSNGRQGTVATSDSANGYGICNVKTTLQSDIVLSGSIQLGGTLTISGGKLTVNNAEQIANVGDIEMKGGTLVDAVAGAHTLSTVLVTANSGLQLSGGTLTVNTLTVNSGYALTITGTDNATTFVGNKKLRLVSVAGRAFKPTVETLYYTDGEDTVELTADEDGYVKVAVSAQTSSDALTTTATSLGWKNLTLDDFLTCQFTATVDGSTVVATNIVMAADGNSVTMNFGDTTVTLTLVDGVVNAAASANDTVSALALTPAVALVDATKANYATLAAALTAANGGAVTLFGEDTYSTQKGLSGTLTIKKGASLSLTTTDCFNYNGTMTLNLYGDLYVGDYHQTIGANNNFNFYTGATVSGLGDREGALGIIADKTINIKKAEGEDTFTCTAPICVRAAITLNVEADVTCNLGGLIPAYWETSIVRTLTKTGLGTLNMTGEVTEPIVLKVSVGKLIRTMEAGETFKVTYATSDVQSTAEITCADENYKVISTSENLAYTYTTKECVWHVYVSPAGADTRNTEGGKYFEGFTEALAYQAAEQAKTDLYVKMWVVVDNESSWELDTIPTGYETKESPNGKEIYKRVATYDNTGYGWIVEAITAAGDDNLDKITVVDASAPCPVGYSISNGKVVKGTVETEDDTIYWTSGTAYDNAVFTKGTLTGSYSAMLTSGDTVVMTNYNTATYYIGQALKGYNFVTRNVDNNGTVTYKLMNQGSDAHALYESTMLVEEDTALNLANMTWGAKSPCRFKDVTIGVLGTVEAMGGILIDDDAYLTITGNLSNVTFGGAIVAAGGTLNVNGLANTTNTLVGANKIKSVKVTGEGTIALSDGASLITETSNLTFTEPSGVVVTKETNTDGTYTYTARSSAIEKTAFWISGTYWGSHSTVTAVFRNSLFQEMNYQDIASDYRVVFDSVQATGGNRVWLGDYAKGITFEIRGGSTVELENEGNTKTAFEGNTVLVKSTVPSYGGSGVAEPSALHFCHQWNDVTLKDTSISIEPNCNLAITNWSSSASKNINVTGTVKILANNQNSVNLSGMQFTLTSTDTIFTFPKANTNQITVVSGVEGYAIELKDETETNDYTIACVTYSLAEPSYEGKVARVGTTGYDTLASAYAAADGATITLLANNDETLELSDDIVIAYNGYTITGTWTSTSLPTASGILNAIQNTSFKGVFDISKVTVNGKDLSSYGNANSTLKVGTFNYLGSGKGFAGILWITVDMTESDGYYDQAVTFGGLKGSVGWTLGNKYTTGSVLTYTFNDVSEYSGTITLTSARYLIKVPTGSLLKIKTTTSNYFVHKTTANSVDTYQLTLIDHVDDDDSAIEATVDSTAKIPDYMDEITASHATESVNGQYKVGETTYAAIKVSSTVVAAPGATTVAGLILSGVQSGDTMQVYKDGKYYGYEYNGTTWEGITMVGSTTVEKGEATMSLDKGTCAVITRSGTDALVLCGEYSENETSSSVTKGNTEMGANVTFADKKVSAITVTTNGTDISTKASQIFVPGSDGNIQYAHKNGAWRKIMTTDGKTTSTDITDDAVVPAGGGYWIKAPNESVIVK